jgi:hypothetical protein
MTGRRSATGQRGFMWKDQAFEEMMESYLAKLKDCKFDNNLEANLNSNVIGVAHIGWISRDPLADNQLKGRHAEYGRSVEDLTGVFSIEKFIPLWGNSTCGAISVDWLPCV